MSRHKKQRAVITIADRADGGIAADITFEPSIKGRPHTPATSIALAAANVVQQLTQRYTAQREQAQ